jgi:HAE1 family hydrophobic/amphiphilic exporter-1
VGLGIIGQAQSNTIDISRNIHRVLDEIGPSLPAGVSIAVSSDDAVFIQGAVSEVVLAMVISVAVVTAIIFVFLRDWRATLIPAVSMPIALSGALVGLYALGFSINILTLLALVLATGLVVDDAIVVLENIVRLRRSGMGARAAAVAGTQEVYFAVLATSVTLAAVFVPISFCPVRSVGCSANLASRWRLPSWCPRSLPCPLRP